MNLTQLDGSLKSEVRKLIADGDLALAVDRLKTASHAISPELYDELVLIEAGLNRLTRDSRRGTIPRDVFEAGLARTAQSLMSVTDEVALAPPPPSSSSLPSGIQPDVAASAVPEAMPNLAHQMILGINNLKQVSWIELGLKVSRSVCRILRSGGGFGTGFMVGNGLLMTNHHVLPTPQEANGSLAEFNYQLDASGGFSPTVRYPLDNTRFVTTGESLDCTLVGVRPDTGKPSLESWGHVTLNPNADPVPSEHVVVIQHPNGGYKQIVLTANYVISVNGGAVRYTTDTMPGSSGSPVFNDAWQVIAIHHMGGLLHKDAAGNTRYVNEGVLMGSIRAVLGSSWPQ